MSLKISRGSYIKKLGIAGGIIAAAPASAGYLNDSHLKVDLKNFYIHRNFEDQTKNIGSWSQGFDLQFNSGYTDTPVAIGFDIDAQYAQKLDSSGNDGSLPYSADEQKASSSSRAGATAKLKYSRTELKIGDMRPRTPIAWTDFSRQLETIYQGAVVESNEIRGLTLTGGRYWSAVTRASSDHEKFYLWDTPDSADSSGLDFAGLIYKFTPAIEATYYFNVMHDLYRQHYLGLTHVADLGDGYNLKTDARFWRSTTDGDARGGKVDNKTYGLQFTLSKGPHLFGFGYQQLEGDSGFPVLNGYIPNLHMVNWSYTVFAYSDERSWTTRYSYDMAGAGLPGLKIGARYTKGTHWERGSDLSDNQQTERTAFATYAVQSGSLKGLSFDIRNIRAIYHYGPDFNEIRATTSYPLNVW